MSRRSYRVSSGLHRTPSLLLRVDLADGADDTVVVIPIGPFEGFPFDLAHRFPWADLVDDVSFEWSNDAFGQGPGQWSQTSGVHWLDHRRHRLSRLQCRSLPRPIGQYF